MTFTTYDWSRKCLVKSGLAATPLVVSLHGCPLTDENPLIVPPQHVEQLAFDQDVPTGLQLQAIASSSGGSPLFPVGGSLDSNNVVLMGYRKRERDHFVAINSMTGYNNPALWTSVVGSTE